MNLQNLVDYCEEMGLPSPFAGAVVPAPLNVDTCISAIMVRCGLLTPCYNDPDTFRNITTIWFERKQWTFEHLINVIQAEYSPIENVFEDRTETTEYGHNSTRTGSHKDTEAGKDTISNSGTDTVAESGTETVAASGTDTVTASGTDERDITNSGTDTTENTISAFNSGTYQPDNKSELTHGLSVDDDITYGKSEDTTYVRSDETTFGKSVDTTHGHQQDTTYDRNVDHVYNNLKDQEGGKDTLTIKRHGNVGTISTSQLITGELELLRHFDIYGYIADLFENDNMLMIY